MLEKAEAVVVAEQRLHCPTMRLQFVIRTIKMHIVAQMLDFVETRANTANAMDV
jgi:hypothetical protein